MCWVTFATGCDAPGAPSLPEGRPGVGGGGSGGRAPRPAQYGRSGAGCASTGAGVGHQQSRVVREPAAEAVGGGGEVCGRDLGVGG